jgi:PAS domain S-box-containing protein
VPRWRFRRSGVAARIEDERVASTVHVVAAASLVGALVWAPLSLLIFPGEWLRSSAVAVVVAGSLLARRLVRRGRVRAAGALLVVMLGSVLASTLLFDGGVHAPARSGLILVVVAAGLLMGPRAALAAAALCVAILGVVALLDARGAIPPVPFIYTPLRVFWIESVYYVAGGVLVAVAAARVQEALVALRASDERWRALAEHSPDLVAEIDTSGRFVYASPNHRAVLGYAPEELVGRSVEEVLRRVDVRAPGALAGVVAGWFGERAPETPLPRLQRIRHRDGSPRWMEVAWSRYCAQDGSLRVLCVSRDVTGRVRLEEQLRETQRLESLGVLAGGIAHDFNNLLTAMLGNTSLARQLLPAGAPAQEYLEDVEDAAAQAAELTGQLLAYAGRAQRRPRRLDLSELVRSVARVVEASLPPGARLVYDLADRLPPVDADPAQLQQVVLNLITNATEALGGAEGDLRVGTDRVDADRKLLDDTVLGRALPEGRYLRLTVADTGCGMNAATVARVFEPFFTTKFLGRGLGLAALLGIARVHRGTVRVRSELGRGTTFEVLLPPAGDAEPAVAERPRRAPHPVPAGGTVLVVEDRPAVAAVARRALEARGYRVLSAATGEEAVARLLEGGPAVVAAVVDFTLPGRNGRETLRALRQLRPGLPALLSSGYDEHEVAHGLEPGECTALLPKPYRAEVLVERVEALLAGGAARA